MSLIISDLVGTMSEWFESQGGYILKKLSSITSPATNYIKLYFKTNGNLYIKDENGTETEISTGFVVPDKTHLESNQAMIGWDIYTGDVLLDDTQLNNFENQNGIDTTLSTNEIYDAGNDWWSSSILVTCAWEASVNNPTTAYTVIRLEPQESYTIGTDFNAFVSTNDGVNYTEFDDLALFQEWGATTDFLRGDLSVLSAMSDKTMRLKLTTSNSKDIKIAAIALGVGYDT